MLKRLAFVIAAAGFLAACALTFYIPSGPSSVECGTWIQPAWDREDARQLAGRFSDIVDTQESLGVGGDARQWELGVAQSWRACDQALHDRRTWSLVALGLGALLPVGMLWVGVRRHPRP